MNTSRILVCAVLAALPAAAVPQDSAPVDELLRATPSGLCVVVGAGDGRLAAKIAEGGRRLVHVLEADEAKLRAARSLLASRNLSGLAAVEPWAGPGLPYPENLVNLLVAEAPVAEADVVRVLGFLPARRWSGSMNARKTLRKPRPAEFGDWTHCAQRRRRQHGVGGLRCRRHRD